MSDNRDVKYHLTLTAAVIVPGLQALISGLVIGVIVLSLALIYNQPHPYALGGVAAALGAGAAWLISLSYWRAKVYQTRAPKLPRVHNADVLRLQVLTHDIDTAYGRGVWADVPVDRNTMIDVARKLAAGASFSHASLCGKHRPLSRAEYEALRTEFIARGLVYWKSTHGHNQGLELSRAGLAAMRRLAQLEPSPLPRQNLKTLRLRDLAEGTNTRVHMQTWRTLAREIQNVDVDNDMIDMEV